MGLSYKRFFKLKRVAKGNGIITISSNESDDYLSKKKTIDVVCKQKVINVTLTFTLVSSSTTRYKHFYNISFDKSALIESGITSITVRCPYSATQISYCDLVYNKSGSSASYRLTMSGSNVVFNENAISRLKQYNSFQLRVTHHAT